MAEHSVLGASSAHRWLNCPRSVKLCQDLPDNGSAYAAEGTRAHEVCAYKLAKLVKAHGFNEPVEAEDKSVEDCADGYVAFVAEKMGKEAHVFIETRVDYSEYTVPGSFGTADCIVMQDGCAHIIDYKHGMGVPVSAVDNPQMELYALGAYAAFGSMFDIDRFELSIYQPRINNVSSFEISLKDLLKKAEEVFRPAAEKASRDEGEFCAGEWCRFCKAKNICRARAEANLSQARKDFALPPTLSDIEVSALLPKLEALIKWAADLQEYALNAALNGKHWDGYKLVEGRSVRKYTDEEKVAEVVKALGFDPYTHKIQTITAMTKLLGKKQFDTAVGPYLTKSQGKPTLVPVTDKRPELNSAKSDFLSVPVRDCGL